MSCCGGNKNRVQTGIGVVPQTYEQPAAPARASAVVFRYDGNTSLATYGGVTGRKYWFGQPGAEVVVDLRDRRAMQSVRDVSEVRLV
jgi:hypothetical protein